MLDLRGPRLLPEEREVLLHPAVGGLILFARNYESPEQIAALIAEVHALRDPPLLVAVDHEGGRVQRFREGFTRLPPCSVLRELYDDDPQLARRYALAFGWLLAAELRAVGVDLSFAPVLDLDKGLTAVVGNRAFHRDPHAVAALAYAYMRGMQRAGMKPVGKHFPGHGSVAVDSHFAVPVDERGFEEIEHSDLIPFRALIRRGLPALMPAHVIYPKIDAKPAGFSSIWLQEILRGRYGFNGAIFSDDTNMAGAAVGGNPPERVQLALSAGCDMVLVCNKPDTAIEVIECLADYRDLQAQERLARMRARPAADLSLLRQNAVWQTASARVQELCARVSLENVGAAVGEKSVA
jgi:beta-N-acetylhexosaminidase